MFKDRALLRKELIKTVGYYQTNNAEYPELSTSLSSSIYDRFINEVSGLIDVENIDQSRKTFSRYPYDQYGGDTIPYDELDVVIDNGVVYEAIQNVPIGIPLTDTSYWFEMDNLNQYLHQKLLQGVDKCLDAVFDEKKLRAKVKSIFENVLLYDGVGNFRDKQANQNSFVGLRFTMKSDRDIVTIINKIGTQFSESVSFNMYLYHSSQQTPLATIPINHTKANSSQWTSQSDLNLRYLDDNYDAGGEFFLGYSQSDLGTSQAINMTGLDWYNGFDCRACDQRSYNYYQNYSPWVGVIGFTIAESSFTPGVDLFDPQSVGLSASTNYGLNVNMTTECDLTPFVIQESNVLAEGIQYATGLEVLRDMASNVRGTNNLANTVREEARKEIVTFEGVRGTVFDRTNDVLSGLSFDLSGLNSACLPCDDKRADIIQNKVTIR